MKRQLLLQRLAEGARAKGVEFTFVREGANHSVYRFGTATVIVPRHREVVERTAQRILRDVGL